MEHDKQKKRKGLFAINTGNGKGKTTAAMGMVFRSLGHGYPVAVVQFLKGAWQSGEKKMATSFPDLLEFHVTGKGFTWKSENLQEDIRLAQNAWQIARDIILAGKHNLVVLDELTYLIKYNMVDESDIIEVITQRPEHVHIIITGRGASPKLQEHADLVTEMKEIKHPYQSGVPAQKGFDF